MVKRIIGERLMSFMSLLEAEIKPGDRNSGG